MNKSVRFKEGWKRGRGGETGHDGKREKIPFMIAGKINTSLSCYNMVVEITQNYAVISRN